MSSDNQKQSEPYKLDEIDIKIIALKTEDPSISDQEIAGKLNLSRWTINQRRNRPEVKGKIQDIQLTALQMIQDLYPKAIKNLETLIDNEDPQVSLNASKEIIKSLQTQKIEVDANLSHTINPKESVKEMLKELVDESNRLE